MKETEITAELVKRFLSQTSVKFGMMDSKKALERTNGDFEKAEAMLLEKQALLRSTSLVTYRIR